MKFLVRVAKRIQERVQAIARASAALPALQANEEHRVGDRDLTHWPTKIGRHLVRWASRLSHWTSANTVLAVALVIGAALVIVLTILSAETYESVTDGDGIASFDKPALAEAKSLRTPTNVDIANFFTSLGGPVWMPVIATLATVAFVIGWRSRTPLVLMLIAVAGSLTMSTIGKKIVGRIRPPQSDAVPPFESSPSFPSGHTINSTVIAGLLAYLVVLKLKSKWTRTAAIVLAFAWAIPMGLSRVFLGHHWLTDVAVGWTLGLAWLSAVITAHRLYLTVKVRGSLPVGGIRAAR